MQPSWAEETLLKIYQIVTLVSKLFTGTVTYIENRAIKWSAIHHNESISIIPQKWQLREAAYALVDVQLEFPLRDALLDALAEGRVARRTPAPLPVLDQTAALPEERRRGRPVVAVLLRAEPVHNRAETTRRQRSLASSTRCEPTEQRTENLSNTADPGR